jgi:transposase
MVFFSPGRGGGEKVEYGYKGKGATSHILIESSGRPLAICTTSAKGDEKDQVAPLLEKIKKLVDKAWKRGKVPVLEADKGYDAKRVRLEVLRRKVVPFIPYRQGSKAKKGVCYLEKFRWKVERTIAWIKTKYRRISIRWERKVKYWEGFLNFAVIGLWLKFLDKIIF